MAKMKDEDLHFMRVTTLTEFKISSFLALSSSLSGHRFLQTKSQLWSWAQHTGLSATLVNTLWRELSLFCLQLPRRCGGFCQTSTTHPAHSLPRAHGLCMKHPFSVEERPAHPRGLPGGPHFPLQVLTTREGCAQLLSSPMEYCLDDVYSFTERWLTLQFLCILMTVLSSSSMLLQPGIPYALLARTHHCNAGLRVCTSD